MKARYSLFQRGRVYYCQDSLTGKQASLRTRDAEAARALIHARNEALRQPFLNVRIAQTYLSASDEKFARRTWQHVMDEFTLTKSVPNRPRCERAARESAFDTLRNLPLVETQAEHFLRVLEAGSVSTNNYLRRYHNFALGMNWLPWPVLPKKLWPPVRNGEKRAITHEEHAAILAREQNPERRAFYELCWHLGGAQSDIAALKAEDIDWRSGVISFFRSKTKTPQIVRIGEDLGRCLRALPATGPLFPELARRNEKQRGALFQCICRRLKITGISLHSYRYAWAQRAKTAGYPERFAQEALGHNSKAVHRAYARKAQVVLPSLEEFEKNPDHSRPPIVAPRNPPPPPPPAANRSDADPSIPLVPATPAPQAPSGTTAVATPTLNSAPASFPATEPPRTPAAPEPAELTTDRPANIIRLVWPPPAPSPSHHAMPKPS